MKGRVVAMVAAALTLLGAAAFLVLGPHAPTAPVAIDPNPSIAPLPEVAPPSSAPATAGATELERCAAAGQCVLVATTQFSNATIEVYQQNTALPAVHIKTTFADGQPSVSSLKDEHSASYQALTCGLANCLLDVVVGPETVASIDLRMISHSLTPQLEGAAVGPSLATTATDLNADGVLDLVATQHLIQGDGSEMLYYRTFVNVNRELIATGCTAPEAAPAMPDTPQTRTCPAL